MNRGLRRPRAIVVQCKACQRDGSSHLIEALSVPILRVKVANHYARVHPGQLVPANGSTQAPLRTDVPAKAAPSARSSRSSKSVRRASGRRSKNPRAGKTPKRTRLSLKLAHVRLDNHSVRIEHERERIDSVEVALARVERITQSINQQRHPNSLPIVVQEREEARNLVRRWVRMLEATGQPVPKFVRTLSETWLSTRPGLTRSELNS